MHFARSGGTRGSGLAGTYFETAGWLHAPSWLVAGSVLVLVGLATLPDDRVEGTDDE